MTCKISYGKILTRRGWFYFLAALLWLACLLIFGLHGCREESPVTTDENGNVHLYEPDGATATPPAENKVQENLIDNGYQQTLCFKATINKMQLVDNDQSIIHVIAKVWDGDHYSNQEFAVISGLSDYYDRWQGQTVIYREHLRYTGMDQYTITKSDIIDYVEGMGTNCDN